MKAVCFEGPTKVGVHDVPDPQILNDRDAIVRVTSTAICGSDLHLYDGYVPMVEPGDIFGHEFMGEVVELGPAVTNLRVGDRVVVPFPIACGGCRSCERGLWSLCENSNPNAGLAEKLMGHSPAGLFGYSHLLGGYPGGQAEYVRVPFADVGPMRIDDDLTDEQVLFLTDVFPTGYMAAEMCGIEPGDVVAVWGAGPVGQFAAASARLLGASEVIVVDRVPERLAMAEEKAGATTVNFEETNVLLELRELTAGRGPDHCIEAVGMEAHGDFTAVHAYDKAKQLMKLQTERPQAIREAILACGNGGTVSMVGVYGGMVDKFPLGSVMNRSLTIRTGQTHVHRYLRPLLEHIRNGDIDPTYIISHRMPLTEAPEAYDMFKHKNDECTKVVLTP
ncbi:zinc-dependent alcohol dehydrogenase [Nocardioides sp. TF02-7]|uniref:zinc-dependent alcohol dehydrogenase n=1 Tax=Nocardioides sp. TF02-7 TaxID=2917724 RepID=UPI001F056756|nr:zinc-dependent alcohol dehydrogenase [Nocardioides sp. TF02-7]UMG91047.1 glutathione-dependent formaldehyde dehydrogenase [Nocardioides sp. TF02-7]